MLAESMSIALKQARERIAQINAELEALNVLRDERDRLERFCEATSACLSGAKADTRPNDLHRAALWGDVTKRIAPDDDRLWKAIHVVMSLRRAPMTAGEVLSGLEEQRIEVNGAHKRETVRTAIARKPDMFERVGRGMFALCEWPDSIKYVRSDDTSDQDDEAESMAGVDLSAELGQALLRG